MERRLAAILVTDVVGYSRMIRADEDGTTVALMDADVDVVAVDMPKANRFTLHIMAAMAEHVAALVSQQTKAALKAAKARGWALGWYIPSRRAEQAQASLKGALGNRAKAAQFAANVLPISIPPIRGGAQVEQGEAA